MASWCLVAGAAPVGRGAHARRGPAHGVGAAARRVVGTRDGGRAPQPVLQAAAAVLQLPRHAGRAAAAAAAGAVGAHVAQRRRAAAALVLPPVGGKHTFDAEPILQNCAQRKRLNQSLSASVNMAIDINSQHSGPRRHIWHLRSLRLQNAAATSAHGDGPHPGEGMAAWSKLPRLCCSPPRVVLRTMAVSSA